MRHHLIACSPRAWAQSAAQIFFKRFFLKTSVMEVDPKKMMLAALYLAGKVEEEKVELEQLIVMSAPKEQKRMSSEELVRQASAERAPSRALSTRRRTSSTRCDGVTTLASIPSPRAAQPTPRSPPTIPVFASQPKCRTLSLSHISTPRPGATPRR